MSETSETGGTVADLKAQRRAPAAKPPQKLAPTIDRPEPTGASPVPVRRSDVLLFAPNESPAVVQDSGILPKGDLSDKYEAAPEEYVESFTPKGQITPVSVLRWNKGDLVRRDVLAAWRKQSGKQGKGKAKS